MTAGGKKPADTPGVVCDLCVCVRKKEEKDQIKQFVEGVCWWGITFRDFGRELENVFSSQ